MTTPLRTGETNITHKMSWDELLDTDAAVSKINAFVSQNAAVGLSPCVIALLACRTDEDYFGDVEVRALLFVECWKDGFDPVDSSVVDRLVTQLQEGKTSFTWPFHLLYYPSSYWVSE